MGYSQAGYVVTGVDINPQPRFPFAFVQGDALEYLAQHGHEYDLIHASPPCQFYSNSTPDKTRYVGVIPQVRAALERVGKPYILENVAGAKKHLINPILLCGTMFGLNVVRHRYFECQPALYFAPAMCSHQKRTVAQGRRPNRGEEYHGVYGHFVDLPYAKAAMGIDWMNRDELAQAIPPTYTRYLGEQMLSFLKVC